MRGKSCLCLAMILGALFVGIPLRAQKVETSYDKNADFSNYKRFTWGKNYLITRQRPEDQARIDKAIVDAINRHLQAKGFVRDDQNPDFVVLYECGGLSNIATGAQMYTSGTPDPLGTTPDMIGTSLDVWATILGKMQIIVTTASNPTILWRARVTKKIRDPGKMLAHLDKEMNQIVEKALKKFPPRAK